MSSSKIISGNRRLLQILVIATGVIAVLFYFIEPLLAGIPAVVCVTLLLVAFLSEDAARNARPILLAQLLENHREIILENAGTLAAGNINVAAVGIEEPWKIATIEPDTTKRLSLPAMVTMLTIEVTYETEGGGQKSKVFTLGNPDTEQDPFKPSFPLFSWQGKK